MFETYLAVDRSFFNVNGNAKYGGPLAFYVNQDGLANRVKSILGNDVVVDGPNTPGGIKFEPKKLMENDPNVGIYLIQQNGTKKTITIYPTDWAGIGNDKRIIRLGTQLKEEPSEQIESLFDVSGIFDAEAHEIQETLGVRVKVRPLPFTDGVPAAYIVSPRISLFDRYGAKEKIRELPLGLFATEPVAFYDKLNGEH